MAALEETFRIISVDLPGHGRSPMPQPGASVSQLAGELAALVREIASAWAHVAGISTGDMSAQSLAIEHPGLVCSLALCNMTSIVPQVPQVDAEPALFVSG